MTSRFASISRLIYVLVAPQGLWIIVYLRGRKAAVLLPPVQWLS